MILFLTSSPFGNYRSNLPASFTGWNPANHFMENISKYWKPNSKVLFISGGPDWGEGNNRIAEDFKYKSEESHLSISSIDVCDERFPSFLPLSSYDVIILGGGHVPTQNKFLHKIGFIQKIQTFTGIVIGISAGSMNCAKCVYAQPEEPGETYIPSNERFIPGLNICNVNVLPHYNAVKNDYVDGKHLFYEVTFPDSIGHTFIAIEDGSYILQVDQKAILYGKGYKVKDGQMSCICENNQMKELGIFYG